VNQSTPHDLAACEPAKYPHLERSRHLAAGWPLWDGYQPVRRLCVGDVHVFAVHLRLDDALVNARRALLSPDERERAARRRIAAKAAEFILTRAALRRVIGGYLDVPPEQVRFDLGEHGKPSLSPEHGRALTFNVTHSHEWALIAVAFNLALGIDVEKMRPKVDYVRLARRFFSPHERGQLDALPDEDQRHAFFRCWARKEAVIKGNGRGIALGLDNFDVTLGPDTPPRLLATRWAPAEAENWQLFELQVAPRYAGALAVRAPRIRVHQASIAT
jgi:4'-phosphopantetheinyl transferase